MERLRTLLARPRAAATATTPGSRTPRDGTKRAAVLALLRRPEGASGPQLAEATGWAPHTVRGFLAGLRKRGVEVTVLERVRQVGPGKDGAKGSYTVYRIAGAA
jgi:biotin operon repressor